MRGKPLLLVSLSLVAVSLGFADTITTIDFEGLPPGTVLTNQYPGLLFSNAIILTAGIDLDASEAPPHSGVNVAFDAFGPITINFNPAIVDFQAFFTYIDQVTVTAFDKTNTQVGQATSLFTNNLVSSGNPPNELLSVSSAGGIKSIVAEGSPSGQSFVMDDVTITIPAASVPEPWSAALLFSVIAGIGLMRRRRISAS